MGWLTPRIHPWPAAVAAGVAGALLLPASALGARLTGVVLATEKSAHVVQVLGRGQAVHAFQYRGNLGAMKTGRRVKFSLSGTRMVHVHFGRHNARRLMFAGTVVGQRPVLLRLTDGDNLKARPTRVRGGRLAAGSAVEVTELVGRKKRETIMRVLHGQSARNVAAETQLQMSGIVTRIDQGSFVVQPNQGSPTTFQISPAQLFLLQMSLCNGVTVTYTAASTAVTANQVNMNGNDSNAGLCNDTGPPNVTPTAMATGPITELTLSGLTITTASGPMTFSATIDLTGVFLAGDTVQVKYAQGGGALLASDIEYDDINSYGTVTSVSAGSLTIDNSQTNQSQTFTDDPGNGTFDGISVGDQVDVAWYMSNGQVEVDFVSQM